jgi:hypothetical protein
MGHLCRALIWQVPFVTSCLIAYYINLGCLTDLSTTTLSWRSCQQVPFTALSHWHICQTHQTWAPSLTVNSDYFLELYELTGFYNVDAVCFLWSTNWFFLCIIYINFSLYLCHVIISVRVADTSSWWPGFDNQLVHLIFVVATVPIGQHFSPRMQFCLLVSLHESAIVIFLVLLLWEGQAGKAWNHQTKWCYFSSWGAEERKIPSNFSHLKCSVESSCNPNEIVLLGRTHYLKICELNTVHFFCLSV